MIIVPFEKGQMGTGLQSEIQEIATSSLMLISLKTNLSQTKRKYLQKTYLIKNWYPKYRKST